MFMSNENEGKIQYLICSQALGQLKQANRRIAELKY